MPGRSLISSFSMGCLAFKMESLQAPNSFRLGRLRFVPGEKAVCNQSGLEARFWLSSTQMCYVNSMGHAGIL